MQNKNNERILEQKGFSFRKHETKHLLEINKTKRRRRRDAKTIAHSKLATLEESKTTKLATQSAGLAPAHCPGLAAAKFMFAPILNLNTTVMMSSLKFGKR